MLYYLNGVILNKIIPDERTLVIKVNNDSGKLFLSDLNEILTTYNKHISCICFDNIENEQHDTEKALATIHSKKIKTCLILRKLPDVNKTISDNLDYVLIENKLYKKDYSPFGDIEDWIEVHHVQSGGDIREYA